MTAFLLGCCFGVCIWVVALARQWRKQTQPVPDRAHQVTSVLVIPMGATFSIGCATFGASRTDSRFGTIADRIERGWKNGEMEAIPWLFIHVKDGPVIEAREADCIIITEAVKS